MFWLWLGLKAMALAFKNPKPGQSQSHGFDWLWSAHQKVYTIPGTVLGSRSPFRKCGLQNYYQIMDYPNVR
jgi:hypothetical protein